MSSKSAAFDLYRSIKRRLLRYELLESRFLLAADSSGLAELSGLTDKAIFDTPQPSAPLTWFESFQTVDRVPLGMLTRIDDSLPDGVAGPLRTSVGEWIVQLTDSASKSITSLSQANGLLTTKNGNFTIISGLGAQGLLLVRGQGATKLDIELSLTGNENVKSFSLNQLIQGQATTPNDPEFVAGLMPGMERIDAKNAWDVSRGGSSTVVGVVDTGIDPTHPDLYLNIWLNQGELPPKYLDDVGPRLVDIDGDGLITFYDLNNATRSSIAPYSLTVGGFATGPNALFVVDKNSNGRIDAIDLLQDANWADGRDTDSNGFFDDFFGVNFRSGATDPFASNNPSDELGHGTHVAGTIGAIGGNGTGVVGVNWQTSLMSLRILDNNNQGDSGAAIRAVNYAREMREQYRVDTTGRVTQGANVRVLNNSWGQPGGYEVSLEAAIRDSSDSGILFVAAAGNGNFLGQGVDNDRTPFYPASYDLPGVIAVAASDSSDRPASFSNFGAKSVDLFAPGVGIRSTLPGGGYGSANGTSMATPHVSGTAALVWSAFPEATIAEVSKAILNNVDPIINGSLLISTGGRLSAFKAINADVFAPAARLVAKQDITTAGGTSNEFTVEFSHRSGINSTTIGNDDLIVTRQWGPADRLQANLKPESTFSSADGKSVTATYVVDAPGIEFINDVPVGIDAMALNTITSEILVSNVSHDISNIILSLDIDHTWVSDLTATLIAPDGSRAVLFSKIGDDQDNFIKTVFDDNSQTMITSGLAPFTGTFKPQQSITTLATAGLNGVWQLEIQDDFPVDGGLLRGWSLSFNSWDALDFGDYVISTVAGKVTSLVGNKTTEARDIGLFNVRINSPSVLYVTTFADSLELGSLRSQIIAANAAGATRTIILDSGIYNIGIPHQPDPASSFPAPAGNSGVPTNVTGWSNATTGDFDVTGSVTVIGNQNDFTVIDGNEFDRVFRVHPGAKLELQRLTVTGGKSPPDQGGGGILSAGDLTLRGAIIKGNQALGSSTTKPIGGGGIAAWNGRVEVLQSWIDDNEGNFGAGVFVSGAAEVNVSQSTVSNNQGGGLESQSSTDGFISNSTFSANIGGQGAISNGKVPNAATGGGMSLSADGRYVAFTSDASNLVLGDTNGISDVFVYDRNSDTIERVSLAADGSQATFGGSSPSLSSDGRFVAFMSEASNLVAEDTNDQRDVFVYDRDSDTIERVSVAADGTQAIGRSSFPSLSADGRFVAFDSDASNLVPGDTNGTTDVFVYDRNSGTIKRVSVAADGTQAIADSRYPSLSADGQFVAFDSFASDLVPGDTNGRTDVFVFDRNSGAIERVSIAADGTQAIGFSGSPSVSADGRFVAFHSDASNLVPDDRNFGTDVFVYDRSFDTIERVSVATDGTQSFGSFSVSPSLSDDGRYVAFTSNASNLVLGDTNGSQDVFLYDRNSDTIERVSAAADGTQADDISFFPSLSADGRFVTFDSDANNLVVGETNDATNGFVFDRNSRKLSVVPNSRSVIYASQLTVAETLDASFAVSGRVELKDTLLINSLKSGIPNASGSVLTTNVIQNPTLGISRIASLVRTGFAPPVRALLSGNPAIDAGSVMFESTVDQRGVLRSAMPDVGAVETVTASIAGTVFIDIDNDQLRDTNEPTVSNTSIAIQTTLANLSVVTDSTGKYALQAIDTGRVVASVALPQNFAATRTKIQKIPPMPTNERSQNANVSSDGRFVAFESNASNLVPGDTNNSFDVFVYDRISDTIERVSVAADGTQANGFSVNPSLSADGRFVAFQTSSDNLVPGDTNGVTDVFVYDRNRATIERVSLATDGTEAIGGFSSTPSLSADGRFVAFRSFASNLVPGDINAGSDVFVYDRNSDTIERVSVAADGTQANSSSSNPSLSADGRFVAFESIASNLIPGDTNDSQDVFVYDRNSDTIKRVSLAADGTQANLDSISSSLSADGRFVAFESRASNLVPGDTNGDSDVFVYDRNSDTIERVSVAADGTQANGRSSFPSLSADGRFVAFTSITGNLVSGDTNFTFDVFVYDRNFDSIERVNVTADGTEANSSSIGSSLSADGRFVAFDSIATNLVKNDRNFFPDIFFVANPFADFRQVQLNLAPGDDITDLDFGILPDPGTISGRVYVDTVANGVFDIGEPAVANAVVFLDLDGDGLLDAGERSINTASDGTYQFLNTDSFRSYSIIAKAPVGFEQVTPSASDRFAWNIFLPAGGVVNDRDFAIRRVQSTGQSSASAVSGRLFDDRNGNNVYDAGVDSPIANREVYLDATNFGVRDPNEPRVLTDANGLYSINGLSSRTVAVTTTLDESLIHLSPLGSDFKVQRFPLFNTLRPFGNPQAIASGDFNQDGFLDVAVALGEGNKISIRLNNGQGGFLANEIDIDLGINGSGPTSLVIGQFDHDSKLDVAVTANFSSKVVVLLNFNLTTKSFASRSYVDVGLLPLDILAGQFGGDSKLDLVIVNKGASTSVPPVASTVQLLTNNGNGLFTAGPPVPTGGRDSVSLVAGNFTGDTSLDVAVVHASPATTGTPFGGVTLLRGNGSGGLALQPSYVQVGALPIDSATADFNADGRTDLAVANFSSNSISILLGQADGTFRNQTSILGTASGAFDIAVGDVDNDGDIDVIASNLIDRNISVFRNIGVNSTNGEVRFEPLENIGLGQFDLAQRMPLVVGNFDNDKTGPQGTGTVDLVTIPQQTNTLHVLKNRLVNGTHRVALTGVNRVVGLDFIIKSAILPPKFSDIANPAPIVEDANEQSVAITGIAKGRITGPALRFNATSSNPALIANPTINFVDGNNQATIRYAPSQNASGTAIITVRAIDAGADQIIGTSDDGVFERSFSVTVTEVNDPPAFSLANRLVSSNEDAGPQSIAKFATSISSGGGGVESTQTLSAFVVTSDHPEYFSSLPAIDPDGKLTYTAAANVSGSTTISVTLKDNGGIANGGSDTKNDFFLINIQPINDAPSIRINGKQIVSQGAGLQTVNGFATGFLPGGGADELTQTIAGFVISVDKPRLFNVFPSISNLGVLTFSPSITKSGVGIVNVQVRDNGGSGNGGKDLSSFMTFEIEVTLLGGSNGDDFGDAPSAAQSGFASSYPTLLADNGAFHTRSDLALGTGFDVEPNGQPNAAARGDDLSNFDDEDGILFPITNAISFSGDTISSFVAIATDVGFLDAWIDFNRDGDWSDLGEQIATKVAVIQGRNNLAFTISSSASAGATFGRFRLSSIGGLPPTGPAVDGEVEDQQVTFVSNASQDVRLNAVELGPHEISVVGNTLVVSASGKTLWSMPLTSVNKFTSLNSTAQTLYEVASPATNLPGTIRFQAIDESIELMVSSSNLVLTGLVPDKLFGIQKIDLTQLGANTLTFAKSDIQALNLQKKLRIVMERMDTLVMTSDWILQTGLLENNTWVQPYIKGDATIEIVSDTAWQNKLLRFDVDGDRSISPLDVLLLINAINSNAFPGTLPQRGSIAQSAFLDPDGDNSLSPLDVLTVINRINRGEGGESEGEGNGEIKSVFTTKLIDDLMVGNIDDLLSDRNFSNGEYPSNSRRRSKRG